MSLDKNTLFRDKRWGNLRSSTMLSLAYILGLVIIDSKFVFISSNRVPMLSDAVLTEPLVSFAWCVLLAWLVLNGVTAIRQNRKHVLKASGLLAIVLISRLLVDNGPLNSAEAERWTSLWMTNNTIYDFRYPTMHIPVFIARVLGVSNATLHQWIGPIGGTAVVACTYALARSLNMSRGQAVLAATIVTIWPAQIRFSGTLSLSMVATALGMGALAVAGSKRFGALREALVLMLFLLATGCRIEAGLLLIPLTMLLWLRNDEIAPVVGSFVVGSFIFWHFATQLVSTESIHSLSTELLVRNLATLAHPTLTPTWWCLLAIVGLCFSGKVRHTERLTLAASMILVLIPISLAGGEMSPLFGRSRYLLPMMPLIAVAAPLGVDYLSRVFSQLKYERLVGGLLCLSAFHIGVATKPIDMQAEAQFIRETANDVIDEETTVVLLDYAIGEHARSWRQYLTPMLSLASAVGSLPMPITHCEDQTPETKFLVFPSLDNKKCIPDGAMLFVGIFRPQPELRLLSQSYDLIPVIERKISTLPATHEANTQCDVFLRLDCLKADYLNPVRSRWAGTVLKESSDLMSPLTNAPGLWRLSARPY